MGLVAGFCLSAVLGVALTGGGAAVPASAATCPQVVVYGVPGGPTAPSGLGATVNSVVTRLKADLGASVLVNVVTVHYPAVPVLDGIAGEPVNGVSYLTSRNGGVTTLGSLLSQLAANTSCPHTLAVLAGYEQGADVIGAYLGGGVPAPVAQRIAAVAMLGDPRFNPKDPYVDKGSFTAGDGPLFASFGIPPAWDHPEGARSVAPFGNNTISECNQGDPVCSYTESNGEACFGSTAWQNFVAAIQAHQTVAPPAYLSGCPSLHYTDTGKAEVTPTQKVTTTAAAHFLAVTTQAALDGWTGRETPLPANHAKSSVAALSSVVCASTSSCVAVGSYADSSGHSQPLVLTGAGASWTPVEAPVPANAAPNPGASLSSVGCPSVTVCVAVGSYKDTSGHSQGLLLTGSGSSWTAAEAPQPPQAAKNPEVSLNDVTCPTMSFCAAIGSYHGYQLPGYLSNPGLLLTGFGSSWTPAQAPVPGNASTTFPDGYLDGVACTSASSCVAVGDYTDPSGHALGLIESGAGPSWSAIEAPVPAGAASEPDEALAGVACPAATQCVAAGGYADSSNVGQGLTLTGSGTSWTATPTPLPSGGTGTYYGLAALACPAEATCVAGGQYQDSQNGSQAMLVSGSGASWTSIEAPLPPSSTVNPEAAINSVSCGNTSACTAAGSYADTLGIEQGLLLTAGPSSWLATQAPAPANEIPIPQGTEPYVGPYLLSAACPSATECVAVGDYTATAYHATGLLETWSGG